MKSIVQEDLLDMLRELQHKVRHLDEETMRIPYENGPPTFTPDSPQIHLDTANNRLYVWNGTAWKYASLT